MTQDQYDKSISTGEVQLKIWDKIFYFFPAGLFICSSIALLAVAIFGNSPNFEHPAVWIIIITIIQGILGILLFRVQKMRLKFEIVKTTLHKPEFLKLTRQISERFKFTPVIQEEDIFVAKTNPEFLSGNVRKQITILLNHDKIMINAIFDPDRKGSVDIMGQNKNAVNTIIRAIDKFESGTSL